MLSIVLCGGGGKSTIYEKYPNIFLDIDYFMWNNSKYIKKLSDALRNQNIDELANIYKEAMINDDELRNDSRIILVHRPINAYWLNRDILKILRPSKELHLYNIKKRMSFFKDLAIADWDSVSDTDYVNFNNYLELENILENIIL
tara:strand:- start:1270 stop:1704 length:435 start_codon:yes stop_codon:yes gene_type:complete